MSFSLVFYPLMKFREQLLESIKCLFRIDAMCFECSRGAAIEVGAEDVDETGSRISFSIFYDPDFRSETVRAFAELGRRPRMQTKLISDANLALRGDGRALIAKSHA